MLVSGVSGEGVTDLLRAAWGKIRPAPLDDAPPEPQSDWRP
jgi:hypothetical protein